MEKLKSIIAALIAAITILGFSAFKEKQSTNNLVWFESNAAGDIGPYIGTFPEPGGNCTETTPLTPRCAVAMDEADVDDSGPIPVSPINNISEDPSLVQQERHQRL